MSNTNPGVPSEDRFAPHNLPDQGAELLDAHNEPGAGTKSSDAAELAGTESTAQALPVPAPPEAAQTERMHLLNLQRSQDSQAETQRLEVASGHTQPLPVSPEPNQPLTQKLTFGDTPTTVEPSSQSQSTYAPNSTPDATPQAHLGLQPPSTSAFGGAGAAYGAPNVPASQSLPSNPFAPASSNPAVNYPPPLSDGYTTATHLGAPLTTGDSESATSPRRGRLGAGMIAALMALSLAGGALGGAIIANRTAQPGAVINHVQPGNVDNQVRPDGSVASTAAQVLPSVVFIEVGTKDGGSSGSGFVISQDGYILTNQHVVDGATPGRLSVTFSDGEELMAEVVGSTIEYDLAVIKVDRNDLPTLTLGDSDAVVVGDPVIAIGAPLGLEGTVTTGIVSALNRPVSAGDSQATAYINSGGPLVNASGEVIGINSAIAQTPTQISGNTTGNIGLGFAISSNQAARTAQQIIETGSATYPIIGVLLDPAYTGEGVSVVKNSIQGQEPVTPGGPAAKAGIRSGDIILAIDGRPVAQSDELIVAIRAKAPGDEVVLTLRDGTSERDVTIVLGEATSK